MHYSEIIAVDEMKCLADKLWDDSFLDQDKDYRAFLEEETVCTPLGPDGPVVSPEVYSEIRMMHYGLCETIVAKSQVSSNEWEIARKDTLIQDMSQRLQ
ncbi:uncharacterized protein LOC122066604 isoform X2 [Macadamia integrifolia]|uniref:uncharacterized protein LOC122066604 isoform X2 n=1 Tax=Macadamia integrifolia TaxID=60698 RepID=UPI001C4EDA94|nr:uncharacterized protein LOC122066604 isoform X2 [Macadamia integrifolia]